MNVNLIIFLSKKNIVTSHKYLIWIKTIDRIQYSEYAVYNCTVRIPNKYMKRIKLPSEIPENMAQHAKYATNRIYFDIFQYP